MRTATKSIVGILSLGVLASSWTIGQSAEVVGFATPAPLPAPNESVAGQPVPTDSATTTPTKSASPTVKPGPTPVSTPKTQATPATPVSASQIGRASYKYGIIELDVTKAGTQISAVNIIQGSTSGKEFAGVPAILAEAAVAANGSNFGNVSGATFTTQAFKSALEAALAKF